MMVEEVAERQRQAGSWSDNYRVVVAAGGGSG